jgi:replication factor A1
MDHVTAKAKPESGGGGGGGSIAKAVLDGAFHLIGSMSPYQNRWTITARITSKGDLKSWNIARGSETFLKIELLDDRGGEIAVSWLHGGYHA